MTNELLQQIAQHELWRMEDSNHLGLFNGKIGKIIFFYHYAKFTNSQLYEEFADELLEELIDDLHDQLPVSFSRGLIGIGWGLAYLQSKGFIEADVKESYEIFDHLLLLFQFSEMKDQSLDTGLLGFSTYLQMRSTIQPSFIVDLNETAHPPFDLSLLPAPYHPLEVWRYICMEANREEHSWKEGLAYILRQTVQSISLPPALQKT